MASSPECEHISVGVLTTLSNPASSLELYWNQRLLGVLDTLDLSASCLCTADILTSLGLLGQLSSSSLSRKEQRLKG